MRFVADHGFYCKQLGRLIQIRAWDRLILDLALDSCELVERRSRLRIAAMIRKDKPYASVDLGIVRHYALLHTLESRAESGDALTGQELIDLIRSIRPVTDRTIRNWARPHGLSAAPGRKYSGDELRRWLRVIARNIPTVREVQEKYRGVSYDVA